MGALRDRRYLTSDLPGTGGVIKSRCEDFRVDEVPLYDACGNGDHTYFQVRKIGVPTNAAVERIARYMGVSCQAIGVAGLKDAHAITTQWMSLEHADEGKLARFRDSQVSIEQVARHTNKLRPGHLKGNAFTICVRDVGDDAMILASPIVDVLARRGVPNFFGPQRFGDRGDTGLLGATIICEDADGFIKLLLGGSREEDPEDQRAARDAFDAGDYEAAIANWPKHYGEHRAVLKAYRKHGDAGRAMNAIDKRMKRLYVSAFQSEIFNAVLAERLNTFDAVLIGDWARKHESGGMFQIEDANVETRRAERFEISATGPMVGYRSELATGEPGEIEQCVLHAFGITREQFRIAGPLKVKGGRRELRFRADGLAMSDRTDEHGRYLEVRFTAPSGSYATVLLGEIMKSGATSTSR